VLNDLRYAIRTLRKSPGFTAVAVVCLALGIGANTTVFSAVNTLLLRPLPFADPDRVMLVEGRTARGEDFESLSYPEYRDIADAGVFAATSAHTSRTVNLGGIDEPERLRASRVSASLFPLLGLRPVLGRNLGPEEDEGGGTVVLLSDGLWRRRFAADPRVVGRAVTINGEPHTVIGVMPRGVRFPETTDLWLPLAPGEAREHRDWRQYEVLARLRPGTSVAQARAAAAALAARMAERYPEASAGRGLSVRPYREQVASQVRPMMLVMLGAVGFVLLIACANVANLLLARATMRRREISIRLALGASRARVVRQLLSESLLLALGGGGLGALLGAWGMTGVRALLPLDELAYWMEFGVDGRVLLMTLAAALGAAAVFGLAPALQATKPDLVAALRDGARGSTGGRRGGRVRGSIVVAQLALSLVLLVGATLMMRSFLRLHAATPGFRTEHVLTFETSLQGARYAEDSAVAAAYDALLARLRSVPGVEAVGAVSQLPVGMCCSTTLYFPEGKAYRGAVAPSARISVVSPSYFDALGIPLLAGRAFDRRDTHEAPPVAIVNRTLADREWPRESPIGKRLRWGADDTTWVTVVGVVPPVKQRELTELDRPQVYVPHAQAGWRSMGVVVRAAGSPAALAGAVRAAARAFDPDLPVSRLRTMDELVRRRMFQPRVYGIMFGVFGLAALLLASLGLYGVMAYAVAQRTQEIGVRMALGARPADVLRLIVRTGARLAAIGLAIGLPAAFATARVLRGALYGVGVADPATFVGIPILLAAVALLASYVPARRAARVDPVVALRAE
jgi:putative ABC transport system permease protein